MENINKEANGKNGSLNDRPLFIQNGNRCSSNADYEEIGNFRRALPQFLAVSVKNILLFAYGMTLGFPTIVIPAVQGGEGREPSDIVLNRDEISWFSSINLICVPLGCLFSGLFTQPIGKRRAMQFVNLPLLGSWIIFHFATKTEHLYAALCLSGLGGGLMEAPVLTYVAEITEPKYRGILAALGSTCVIGGVFIQFIMGSLMDWRTIAAVNAVFPIISIITLCFVPESPTWLICEERFREAVKSLQWLRGWVPEHKIEEEFNQLYEDLITKPALEEAIENNNVPQTKWKKRLHMFRKRSFLVPFLLVAYTFFSGHFSGKTPLQTYAVQIFHTLKAPINKYHATILLGVAELAATVLCVFLVHFTGKRPLVLVSLAGVGACFFGTATYAYYLKIVPGFAVNNVVVNASFIVPKDSIITQDNITKIFESEEKALLVAAGPIPDLNKQNLETTTWEDQDLSTTFTTLLPIDEHDMHDTTMQQESTNRTKRSGDVPPNDILDLYNLTFVDLNTLFSTERSLNDSDIANYDLFDSEEDNTVQTTTTITLFKATEPQQPTKIKTDKMVNASLPVTTTQVPNEILLSVPKQELNNLVYVPLVLLLAAAFFSHMGIRMIPWILIGEVFPAQIRGTAAGLVSGLGYVFGFLANKLFLQMLSALTMPGTFWFYASVAFLAGIVLYFTLPETEGRTLAEIEAHFSKKSSTDLLSKSWKHSQEQKPAVHLDNLQNLHIPIDPRIEAKIIQLQQSDLVPQHTGGQINLGFEDSTTTRL